MALRRSWEPEAVHCLAPRARPSAPFVSRERQDNRHVESEINVKSWSRSVLPGCGVWRIVETRRLGPSAELRRKTDRPCRMSAALNSRGIIGVHCSVVSGSRDITVLFSRLRRKIVLNCCAGVQQQLEQLLRPYVSKLRSNRLPERSDRIIWQVGTPGSWRFLTISRGNRFAATNCFNEGPRRVNI